MLAVLLGLVGLAVGSFLNVLIDRLPRQGSILFPPSHCEACGHRLSPWDLVPVLSYLLLRGRCRYCRASIPRRIPLVEALTGLIFGLLAWHYGPGWELVSALVYLGLFIPIFFIDLENGIIPDALVFPGMALALGFSFVLGRPLLRDTLAGGGVGFGLMLLPYLLSRGGMGFGDVKFAGLMGLVNGFPLVAVGLLFAFVTGGLLASLLLLFRVKGRKDPVPLGPFLVAGSVFALLWGRQFLDLYLNLLGR